MRLRCLIRLRQLDAAHARASGCRARSRRSRGCSSASSASSADVARTRRAADRLQHDLERVEVARLVVDDQDLDVFGSSCVDRAQRYSHTRSSDSSWSVLTGLAM